MKNPATTVRAIPSRLRRKCLKAMYRFKQLRGAPISVNISDDLSFGLLPAGQIPELIYVADFERMDLALVAKHLKPGMGVLDIGANVGLYSITAAKLVGTTGQVIAFEPSAESHERLMANLRLNGLTSIEVLKMALADSVRPDLTMQRDPGHRDGDRYLAIGKEANLPTSARHGDAGDIEHVSVTSVDNYLYTERSAPVRIDFLKMDIEGGEYAVFQGAKRFLSETPDLVMMFECTPQSTRRAGCTQEDVFSLLGSFGFAVHAWNPQRCMWVDDVSSLKTATNVWASRNESLLPRL